MQTERRRFLMWFGDIVAEYKLSPAAALTLFLVQRFGRSARLTDNCICAATRSAKEKNSRLLKTLKDRGLVDYYERFKGHKTNGFNIILNEEVHARMDEMYELKKHCFRADAIFRKTNIDLKLSDIITYLGTKSLQLMDNFKISIGTLVAYTGLSYNTIRATLETSAISSRFERKYRRIDELKTMVLYRIKNDMEESIFLSPARTADKVYIVSRALVKAKKASQRVKDFVYNIHHMNWDCYNATEMLMVLKEISDDERMAKAVKRLFGYDMPTLALRGYALFGYAVRRDKNCETLKYKYKYS